MDGDHPAGGSRFLAELIDQFGEVLVADLKSEYQVDLRDIFVEGSGLSPRLALTYIRYLPMGSAFVAERRGGQQFRGWDESRYISVASVNGLRSLLHVYISAHTKGKTKPPEPYPIPDRKKKNQADKPGSFAAIAKSKLDASKRRKEGL